MRVETLLAAIGDASDEYKYAAAAKFKSAKKREPVFGAMKILAAAASIVFIIGFALFMRYISIKYKDPAVTPSVSGTATPENTEAPPEFTSADKFDFTLLDNGTYSVAAKKDEDLPETVSIPSSFDGKAVTEIAESAFARRDTVKTVYVPEGVVMIGSRAFQNCTALEHIYLPDSVTETGSLVFGSCSSLQSISLPKNLKEIPYKAFIDCTSLKNVSLPEGLIYIRNDAFVRCKSLCDVVLPDSLTVIEADAFADCKIDSINIPDNVNSLEYVFEYSKIGLLTVGKWIGSHSLYNVVTDVKEITVTDDVTHIAANAFSNTTAEKITLGAGITSITNVFPRSVKTVILSPDVKTIEESAFSYCSALTEITLPEGLTSIGSRAFYECKRLKSIVIPDSVTSVGREAFANCVLLESVTIGDNVAAGEINWLTFSYNWNENRGGLKTVTVGRWIENNSLSFLPNLENVIVRDGVTKIADKAFNNMKKLKSVSLCEGIGSIGEKAFSDCESLASLKIPDSVRSIGNNAFDNCASLKYNEYGGGYYLGSEENPYLWFVKPQDTEAVSITLHESTAHLFPRAFMHCVKLQTVNLSKGITEISDYAFLGCSDLKEFVIPDTVEKIGMHAFSSCDSLENIVIPESVRSIGRSAFSMCPSLEKITIPDSVTQLGAYMFAFCRSLNSVKLPAGANYGDCNDMFCICGFTELTVPDVIETVAAGMFSSCSELRSVTISDGVKTVGSGAFEWCLKLTEVTVPESVTLIQSNAFYNCPLSDIYYAGTVEQWRGVFTPAEIYTSDNIYTCTVHCKDGNLTFDYYFDPYEGMQ